MTPLKNFKKTGRQNSFIIYYLLFWSVKEFFYLCGKILEYGRKI